MARAWLTFLAMLVLCSPGSSAQERPLPLSGFASGGAVSIGPGDLLHMTVFDTPELTGSLRVSNAGEITVPLRIADMPDRVVWLPTNSAGCAVRRQLGAGHGASVRVRSAQ